MTKKFTVIDPVGLHARPATVIVTEAGKFASDLKIEVEGKEADLKSVMGVMALAIGTGQEFTVTAEGSDSSEAMEAVTKSIIATEIGKEI